MIQFVDPTKSTAGQQCSSCGDFSGDVGDPCSVLLVGLGDRPSSRSALSFCPGCLEDLATKARQRLADL